MKEQKIVTVVYHIEPRTENNIDLTDKFADYDSWDIKQITTTSFELKPREGSEYFLSITALLERD